MTPGRRGRSREPAAEVDSLYIAYWSLRDPLCLTQSIPVLRALAGRGRRLALMTFEQHAWELTSEDQQLTRKALIEEGIVWIPRRYHKRPAVLSTLYDIVLGVWHGVRFARRRGVRLVHSRGTVAGAIGYLTSRLAGALFLFDADGPLSQEYVDAGVWRRGSIAHRLTAAGEARFLRAADSVAVLTERRKSEVRSLVRPEVTVVPCAVDLDLFTRDLDAVRSRQERGLRGTVFVYAGKAGGWYLTGPMLDFVQMAREVFGEVTLLILTTEDPGVFRRGAEERGLPCVVHRADHKEMPHFLSLADVGLSFVLSAPSKSACSPVKNGEYLACGLPLVTTALIGDYSDLVVRNRVGVVVEELSADAYRRSASRLRDLLEDGDTPQRCRQVAGAAMGLQEVVIPRYRQVYQGLLGPEHSSVS